MLRPDAVVINTSRGEVVDGEALVRSGHPCALDVWEHEPAIDRTLLDRALIATPTSPATPSRARPTPRPCRSMRWPAISACPSPGGIPRSSPSTPRPISWQELCRTIGGAFDIEAESRRLKENPTDFEALRDHYAYRREYF